MEKTKKRTLLLIGSVVVLVLALGVTAVFAQEQEPDTTEPEAESGETLPPAFPGRGAMPFKGGPGQRGFGGPAEGQSSNDELLAEILGVDVEELQAAREKVGEELRVAALDQALADGLITEEQYEAMLEGDFDHFGMKRGFGGRGSRGHFSSQADVDVTAMLAAELDGVSVEQLEAAQEELKAARLQELLDNGYITQEQIDLMEARQAIKEYMDLDLEALKQELEGKSFEEIAAAMQEVHQAAIDQALADGAITADQAELLSEGFAGHPFGGGRGFGCEHGSGGRGGNGGARGGRGHDGGFPGFGPAPSPDTTGISL